MSEDDIDGDSAARSTGDTLALSVAYDAGSDLVHDYRENIAQGQTYVITSREATVGTKVRLRLSFPGLLAPIVLDGVVTGGRPTADDPPGLTLDFNLPEGGEARAHLDALVERIAAGDPALMARIMRVLLVEDNPHVAALIRDGLHGGARRELGGRIAFVFDLVDNGRTALEKLAAEPYDLLVTDIYMPILDGANVIKELRKRPATRRLPVIAMSSGGPGARDAAERAGADYFLEKPMRLAALLETMREIVDRRR